MAEINSSNRQQASLMISYSRRDKEFVQDLFAALTTSGIPKENIWIDWDDIPPAADWMEEITRAIGAADAIVFVISSDSLKSKVCGDEIRIAIENNKKLIPILYREPQDGDPIHEKISSTNWIFMNQDSLLESEISTLLKAINTDLDWVLEHTRTLERAIEWDQQERDKSFLLRGVDLENAESWQANAVQGKNPQPTRLQAVYIQASRQDAKRRRRNLLIGVSFALVVSVALGITAVIQWQETQRQAEINLVRQLSAQASSKMDERLDLASLLSLEALRLSERSSTTTDISRAEGVGSLMSVVTHKPALNGYLHGHEAQIIDVDINFGAGLIATASEDGTVRLIDLETLILRHLFQKDDDELRTATISPDGNKLATGGSAGIISLWDTETFQLIGEISDGHDDEIFRILYHPKGNALVTAGHDGQVIEYNPETLKINRVVYDSEPIASLAYNPAGSELAIGTVNGYIDVVDTTNGNILYTIDSGFDDATKAIAFNDDGTILASGGAGQIVDLWDVETQAALDHFEFTGVISINSLTFDPLGDFLAVGSDNRNVFLVSVKNNSRGFGEDVHLLSAHVGEIFDIDISNDGNLLLSGGVDQTAILWNVRDGLEGRGTDIQTANSYHEADVNKVAFSPDGRLLASAGDDSLIYIKDLTGDKSDVQVLTGHNWSVQDVVFDPNGKLLASSDSDGVIILWDVETGQRVGEKLKHGVDVPWFPLAFSPDGKLLASGSSDGSVILWDTITGQQVGETLFGHSEIVMGLAFNPDGSILASGSADFNIILWDVAIGKKIITLPYLAQVQSLLFTPDGNRLISGGFDAMVRIWDVETGDQIHQLSGHLGDVTDLAFNPDKTLLASASTDGNVILWDLQSLERIGHLSGSPASLIGVAFSPTESLVAAASRDDNVYLWETDIEAWKEFACFRANRNLTQAEWNRYIGSQEAYHLSCPEFPPPIDLTNQ